MVPTSDWSADEPDDSDYPKIATADRRQTEHNSRIWLTSTVSP